MQRGAYGHGVTPLLNMYYVQSFIPISTITAQISIFQPQAECHACLLYHTPMNNFSSIFAFPCKEYLAGIGERHGAVYPCGGSGTIQNQEVHQSHVLYIQHFSLELRACILPAGVLCWTETTVMRFGCNSVGKLRPGPRPPKTRDST